MARTHAAMTNGGWQAPNSASPEQDPRNARAAPGQRPAQPGAGAGYPPQAGYPAQGAGYDPQQGYHYPQQQPGGQPQAAPYPGARPGYGQAPQASAPQRGYPPMQAANDPLTGPAASFRQPGSPAPFAGGSARQPEMGASAAGYDQWSAPGQDPRGYDLGSYMPSGAGHPEGDPLQHPEWGMQGHAGYGEPTHDQAYQAAQLGYDQPHAGALEQAYSEEGGEYEVEEPRRGSWAMRIAGAIVVAIGLGYGLAQGYKFIVGATPEGTTPVVRGDDAPAKTKPSEPGGKQFAHTDSKVMGRLGDGTASGASVTTASTDQTAGATETDANGARKVTTLVVGRDGSIVPPEQPTEPGGAASSVPVPGVTMVDGFGTQYPGAVTTTAAVTSQQAPAAAGQPVVVTPPASESKPVDVAKVTPVRPAGPPPAAKAPAPPQPPAAETKTAAVAPPAAPRTAPPAASSGSNGYVAVLASVPASNTSRLAALKRFADMQQQYGSVLQNKTPDVKEANLGAKGIYHRLLVGPPGSRAQASALCSELKQAGYKDCWVTAY